MRIKHIDRVTALLPAWQPYDIAFIKQLEWLEGNLFLVVYCHPRNMAAWPDLTANFFEVTMFFENVRDVKFALERNAGYLHQVSGFDIVDITKNCLEQINYMVSDYEESSIRFNCEEIEIRKASGPLRISYDIDYAWLDV